ncbi:Regulator of G protein signaling superfamily, partial [Metarhizium majus ARSEF 297]
MYWPTWLTWYKKPEYRNIKEYSDAIRSGKRDYSPDRGGCVIPSQLRLDRVLGNKTCSPMSLFDFYMYLKHIEFSEENLEFYMWYKNYQRCYNGPSAQGMRDCLGISDNASSNTSTPHKPTPTETKHVDVGAGAVERVLSQIRQLLGASATCTNGTKCKLTCVDDAESCEAGDDKPPEHSNSDDAYRDQVLAIARTFLLPGAPKELNIPCHMRSQVLADIQTSSHPSHLESVADHVYQLLQHCSHRNFVRLGIANGTFETVCVATGLGIVLMVAGLLTVLLLAFTPYRRAHSPWTVFAAWPMLWLGMSLVLSGLRGSCFFLLLFSRRQPLPWERFADEESGRLRRTAPLGFLSRLMIFDNKVRVKDLHLRRLQHKIVIQSLVGGATFASLGMLVFIFLPVWRTF